MVNGGPLPADLVTKRQHAKAIIRRASSQGLVRQIENSVCVTSEEGPLLRGDLSPSCELGDGFPDRAC
jgi:hypothetical protein